MELDRGPMAPTNEKLDAVLYELYSLNLALRDLVNAERAEAPAPIIQVSGPDVDLSELQEALSASQRPVDLSPLLDALSALSVGSDGVMDAAILDSLAGLRKEFADLGVGMRAIAGSQSMGGGGQVFLPPDATIKLDPSQVIPATIDSSSLAGLALDATLTNGTQHVQVDNFPAFPVTQPVQDFFTASEELVDQTGAAGVLTFTFSSAVQLAFVRATGGIVRFSTGTPSATQGGYAGDGESTPIPRQLTTLKVYAPAGVAVSVWGFRY